MRRRSIVGERGMFLFVRIEAPARRPRRWPLVPLLLGLALLAASLAPAAAPEEPGSTWTLEEVFRHVLAENETVARAQREVAKAEAFHRGAWSQVIPSLNLSGNLTRYDEAQVLQFGETEEGEPVNFEIVPLTDWNYSINLRQILYAGGRPRRALRVTDNLRGVSGEAFSQVRQQILLAVSAAYLEILKAERTLEIGHTELELAQRQQQVSRSLFEAGEAVRASILRAEVAVVSAERGVVEAENRVARARENFAALTGLRGDYRLLPPPLPAGGVDDLEPLVEEALRERPEMRRIDLELKNAGLYVEIARGEFLPTLTADVNWFRQKSAFPASQWMSGVLGLSFPIFDGGLALSHLRIAREEEAQVRLARAELEKEVRRQVTDARLVRQDLEKTRAMLERQVGLARQTYEDISRFYAAGEATDLDQLEAQRTLIASQRLLADADNDLLLADYALQASRGVFARGLGGSAEGEPESAEPGAAEPPGEGASGVESGHGAADGGTTDAHE